MDLGATTLLTMPKAMLVMLKTLEIVLKPL
jgi:hypothetical protein